VLKAADIVGRIANGASQANALKADGALYSSALYRSLSTFFKSRHILGKWFTFIFPVI